MRCIIGNTYTSQALKHETTAGQIDGDDGGNEDAATDAAAETPRDGKLLITARCPACGRRECVEDFWAGKPAIHLHCLVCGYVSPPPLPGRKTADFAIETWAEAGRGEAKQTDAGG